MGRVARFAIVGAVAGAVHVATVTVLVAALGLAPLVANVAGFAIAFGVSYAGQRRWTFGAGDLPHRRSLPRYLAVALGGFALNESLYALLLGFTPLHYIPALVLTVAAAATATYLASRSWAFAPRRSAVRDKHDPAAAPEDGGRRTLEQIG